MYPDIKLLPENAIPGASTWNVVARMLRNIHSSSEGLNIRRASDGSLEFEMAETEEQTAEQLLFDFRATLNGTSLAIANGHIDLPDGYVSVSSYSGTGSNGRYFWLELGRNNNGYTASWRYGGSLPDFYDLENKNVNIPMLQTITVDGILKVRYYHIGSVFFGMTPYVLIPGFSASSVQSLDHDANGLLKWTTYGVCENA